MVIVNITTVQEVSDAMFQGLKWGFDRKQFVSGDDIVIGMTI